jgi:hypothetical protein
MRAAELGKCSGRINAVFAGDLIARETMMQVLDTSVEALPVATTLDQESSRKRQGMLLRVGSIA